MGDVLKNKLLIQNPLRVQVEAAQVILKAEEVFKELFGPELGHLKILFVKNRTLTITCHSSVVAQEIRLNQAKILEKINSHFPATLIDRIRYLA